MTKPQPPRPKRDTFGQSVRPARAKPPPAAPRRPPPPSATDVALAAGVADLARRTAALEGNVEVFQEHAAILRRRIEEADTMAAMALGAAERAPRPLTEEEVRRLVGREAIEGSLGEVGKRLDMLEGRLAALDGRAAGAARVEERLNALEHEVGWPGTMLALRTEAKGALTAAAEAHAAADGAHEAAADALRRARRPALASLVLSLLGAAAVALWLCRETGLLRLDWLAGWFRHNG